jgi:large-conductance mechanosensitive channel
MKKQLASLLLLVTFFVNSQEIKTDSLKVKRDTIVYHKTTAISEARTFTADINEKYNGKDFEYTENEPEKRSDSNLNLGFLSFFGFFMQSVFPFLLGGFIVFIIVKAMLGYDVKFWKRTKNAKKIPDTLIYEDEDIHEVDLAVLLKHAIEHKNFRLAIRYYYLMSLKSLSTKNIIEYHKDKTNSEYLFEIENSEMRSQFSYLSYVYSYVWYGEFPVDEVRFTKAQLKYQSFLKSIH